MPKALEVRKGNWHPKSGWESSKSRIKIVVLLIGIERPSKPVEDPYETTVKELAVNAKFPLRTISICLTSAYIEEKVDKAAAYGELEVLMQSVTSGKFDRKPLLNREKATIKFFILNTVDTAWMIKEVMSKHNSIYPQNTIGLLFVESCQHVRQNSVRSIDIISVSEFDVKISKSFNNLFFELQSPSLLNPITWMVTAKEHPVRDCNDSQSITKFMAALLELGIKLAEQERPLVDIGRDGFIKDRKGLVKDGLVQKAELVISNIGNNVVVESYSDHIGRLSQGSISIGKRSLLQSRAEALLRRGDLKQAFLLIKDGNDTDVETLVIRTTLKLYLENQKEAEQDLRRVLHELHTEHVNTKNRTDRTALQSLEREVSYRHVDALLLLGDYEAVLSETDAMAKTIYTLPEHLDASPYEKAIHSHSINMLRLRAMAIAYLGFPGKSDVGLEAELHKAGDDCRGVLDAGRHRDLKLSREEKEEYQATSTSILLARSRIAALRGDYEDALSIIWGTLSGSVRELGEDKLLTLEVAVLASQLCVLTSRVTQGKELILKSQGIITKHYGPDHPLALEAACVLISVAQAEGRLTQAREMSLNLWEVAKAHTGLGIDHPLVLECQTQLGSLHIRCGNYLKAEKLLSSACKNSAVKWTTEHPRVFRMKSEYALAQYHSGKTVQAWEGICAALRGQLRFYLGISEGQLWKRADEVVPCLRRILSQHVRTAFQVTVKEAGSRTMSHPNILHSLLILGKIEIGKESPDYSLALEAFDLVWRGGNKKLSRSSDIALEGAIALGKTLLIAGSSYTEKVWARGSNLTSDACFRYVTNQTSSATSKKLSMADDSAFDKGKTNSELRSRQGQLLTSLSVDLPGDNHPIVLRARHEALMANVFTYETSDGNIKSLRKGKNDLKKILKAQENRPGWDHPDRLMTMLSLLGLQMALDDHPKDIIETQQELLQRLGKPEVFEERVIQALSMQESIGKLLYMRPRYSGQAREAYECMRACLKSFESANDQGLHEEVAKFQSKCDSALEWLEKDHIKSGSKYPTSSDRVQKSSGRASENIASKLFCTSSAPSPT